MIIWFHFKFLKIQRVFKKKNSKNCKGSGGFEKVFEKNYKDNGKWFFSSENKVSSKPQKT
jgi:hypothetical protein